MMKLTREKIMADHEKRVREAREAVPVLLEVCEALVEIVIEMLALDYPLGKGIELDRRLHAILTAIAQAKGEAKP